MRWTAWRPQEHFFLRAVIFFAAVWLRTAFFRICRRVTEGGFYRFPTFRRNVVPSSSRFQWYERNSPWTARPSVVASYSSEMYFVIGRGTALKVMYR